MNVKMTSAIVAGFLALGATSAQAQRATTMEPVKQSMAELLNSGEYTMGTQAMDGRGNHSFVLHGQAEMQGEKIFTKVIYCIVKINGNSGTSECFKLN